MGDTTDDDGTIDSFQDADPTFGMTFDLTPDVLRGFANDLEDAEAADTDGMDDEELAEYVSALKWIEDAANTARDVFEDALDDRVEAGESIGDLTKVGSERSYVRDDGAAFDAVLDAGHDPREVASVKVGALRDVLGADAEEFLGSRENTYFRRQG